MGFAPYFIRRNELSVNSPISLPGNAHIRYEDIERFQNSSTKDLILQGVRGDGSVILANRSAFGRALNWLNTKVLGRVDPNAQAVANLFLKQVRGLEHGGQSIVNTLNLNDVKSIRNREVRLVLKALAGDDGNARFRFNDRDPLGRRKEESDDLALAFQSNGEFFQGALSESGIDNLDISQYDQLLQHAFDDHFSRNKKAPSSEEGFDIAIQVLRAIGSTQTQTNQSIDNPVEEFQDESFAFIDGPNAVTSKENEQTSWTEEDELADTATLSPESSLNISAQGAKSEDSTPEEIEFQKRESHLKAYFEKEKLPSLPEEEESEAIGKPKPSNPVNPPPQDEVTNSSPIDLSKTSGESIAPRPYQIRQQEIRSALLFAKNLHTIDILHWEDQSQNYLSELNQIEKETQESDLTYELNEAQASFEYKLGLPKAYRQLNHFVNQFQQAAPQKLLPTSDGEGENLSDTLAALSSGKSIYTIYQELREYKSFCENQVQDRQKEASKIETAILLKHQDNPYPHGSVYPPLAAARSELALVSSVINNLDRHKYDQTTKLGYLNREEVFQKAEQVFENNLSENFLSPEDIENAILYLAQTGSQCELYANSNITTEDQRILELKLRNQIIGLIEKYQTL